MRPRELQLDGPNKNLLIVEGADDFHTLTNLFDAFGYRLRDREPEREAYYACRLRVGGSHAQIRDRIKDWLLESDLQYLGLIVDADGDMVDSWHSVRDAILKIVGYKAPDLPDPLGTVIPVTGRKTIGVWLMPDNSLPGAIEDFAHKLIPEQDVLWTRADEAVDSIPAEDRSFPDISTMKAKIHTWLAWQKEPGKPIGQAINKTFLNSAAPQALALKAWMDRLFQFK